MLPVASPSIARCQAVLTWHITSLKKLLEVSQNNAVLPAVSKSHWNLISMLHELADNDLPSAGCGIGVGHFGPARRGQPV